MHCADPSRKVPGIETSSEAIVSAQLSSRDAGLLSVDFQRS
ncbi:hypothetical protein [Arthrobacter sp. D1-17]